MPHKWPWCGLLGACELIRWNTVLCFELSSLGLRCKDSCRCVCHIYKVRQNATLTEGLMVYFLIFLNTKLCCVPSLELSHRDSSNEGSQHRFTLRFKKNISELSPFTPLYQEL